jgi:hypothetical protein
MKPRTVVFSFMVGLMLTACAVENQPAESKEPTTDIHPAQAASPQPSATFEPSDYEIVTLLPFDAIPSIDEPRFYDAEEADQEYEDHELVIGVAVDGEARAYPIDLLSRHEIVNDTIAGHPIAVTW